MEEIMDRSLVESGRALTTVEPRLFLMITLTGADCNGLYEMPLQHWQEHRKKLFQPPTVKQ